MFSLIRPFCVAGLSFVHYQMPRNSVYNPNELNKSSRLGDTKYTLAEDSMFIGLETTKLT